MYATASYTGDGITNIFTVPFPYIDQVDVHVYVNGSEETGFTWPTSGSVQLTNSAGSLSGAPIVIKRITPITDPVVTFQDGGLDPNDLNTAFLQQLYGLQELWDAQT